MYVTLFGIIWLLVLVICMLAKDIKPIISILLFSMILQSTNVLVIGETGIGPHIVTSSAFIVKSYFYLPTTKMRASKQIKTIFFVYSLFLIYIILNGLIINKYSSWVGVLMMGVYLISASRLYVVGKNINKKFIEKNIDFLSIFVLIIGGIVCLQQLGFIPKIGLLKSIFFNDDISGTVAYNTIDTARFYATFMEPSYCACFLVGCVGYYLCIGKPTFKYISLIVLLSMALVLTLSSTGYGCFALTILAILVSKTNKRTLKRVLPIGIIVSIFVLLLFPNLLNEVIFDKLTTASGQTRHNWNLFAIESFYSSPIFGIGYSNQRASSLFYTLLAELGIIGIILYGISLIIITFELFFSSQKLQSKQYYIFMFSVIIGQIIACPDLNFCVFWLGMFLFALGESANNCLVDYSIITDRAYRKKCVV